jgi:hypothetical protein
MKGKKKTPKIPGFMRSVLAENVGKLMARAYKGESNRPKALSIDAGVSLSTVQRIIACETGATLDNIEQIAAVFDLSTYQILLPGLNIESAPVVPGALQAEKTRYRRWQQQGRTGKKEPMESER